MERQSCRRKVSDSLLCELEAIPLPGDYLSAEQSPSTSLGKYLLPKLSPPGVFLSDDLFVLKITEPWGFHLCLQNFSVDTPQLTH